MTILKFSIRSDKERLRDFFDNAPVGFHVFGPDRVIIDINWAELQMIGYQREEIVGKKTWGDLILRSEKSVFEQHWKDINTKGKVLNIPYTLIHKDGHHVEVLLSATARFDPAGKLINTRGSVLDITQRNEMQRHLVSCESQLRKQKLALEQTNAALNEILTQLQDEKKKIKNNVVHNVEQMVRPLLAKLKKRVSSPDQRTLDLLTQGIDQITTDFGRQLVDQKWRLSRREIEICHMIKNGLSTKNIADLLNVSIRTIDNHRDNIRRKLNVGGKRINLVSYLEAFS